MTKISELPANPGLTSAAKVEVTQNGSSYQATVGEWNDLLTADVDAAVAAAEAAQTAAEAAQAAAEVAQADAGASSANAALNAGLALTRANNAATSASAASTSATNAATSATTATTQATAASSSATAAATSATNAATSATTATTQATAAAASATSASSSASAASATLAAALRGDISQSHTAATRRQMRTNEGVANWFNVADYGADSTGATDSYTAIAAAITAAGVGGAVYFPAGTWRSDTPLAPLEGQIWFGDGMRQSFLTTQNASGSARIVECTADSVTIRDLGFKGYTGKASAVADIALWLTGAEDCIIERVWCDGQVQRFFFCEGGSHGTMIRHCRLDGTRQSNVIELNGSHRCTVADTEIMGQNTVATETGIEYYSQMAVSPFLSPIVGMRVINVRIRNVGGNGINFHGCENSEILNCHIEETRNKGIFITRDEYSAQWARGNSVRVVDNTLINCSTKSDGTGGATIQLDNITGAVVRGNQLIISDLSLSRYAAFIEVQGSGNTFEDNMLYTRPGLWRGSAVGYVRYGFVFSAGNSSANIFRRNRVVNLSYGTHASGGATAGNGADGFSIQGDANVLEENEVIDERIAGTTRYVANAAARLALTGLRIGWRVIEQDTFDCYEVIPHAQTTTGLLLTSANAWGKVSPPPHFVVASQAAMLALENATVGDICVRTDLSTPNKVKYLTGLPASTLGNWSNLVPGDAPGMLATGLCSPCLRYGFIIQSGCKGNILRNNSVRGACVPEAVHYPNYDNGTNTRWGPFTRQVTIDVGNVAAGATVTQTVTFDTANVRQRSQVHIGVPHDFPTGLTVRGYVASNSVTYTVTLVFQNFTGGDLNPASGDYIITVTEA